MSTRTATTQAIEEEIAKHLTKIDELNTTLEDIRIIDEMIRYFEKEIKKENKTYINNAGCGSKLTEQDKFTHNNKLIALDKFIDHLRSK